MPIERLSSAFPVQQLMDHFSTQLPEETSVSESYETAPEIYSRLKISHAKNGELKIVCESSKIAQYIMGELKKIRDEKGQGLNCFYANDTQDCAYFYIAASKMKVLGQETKMHADSRWASDEEQPGSIPDYNDKLNNYGVYQSKGNPVGSNKKLSLHCPNSTEGLKKIEQLLGLDTLEVTKDKTGIERAEDSFYFDLTKLPYKPGNENFITTRITINSGLRRPVGEIEDKSRRAKLKTEEFDEISTVETSLKTKIPEKDKKDNTKVKTYSNEDAKLVLHAAIQMTTPNQYWESDRKDDSHDHMFVYNGTAYQQSGWKGGDHETMSLKWVNDKGEMKLAVSYYAFYDCFMSTLQKAATYLISFNENGSAMSAELIDVPNTEAISVAKSLKQQKDNSWKWEPIEGSVYVPSGGEVIDALTEWSKAFNTKTLLPKETPTPGPEDYSEWVKSKNGLEVFLKSRDLLLSSDNEKAQEMMVQLQNRILNDISAGSEETYEVRLHAVKEVIKILQVVGSNPKKIHEDDKATEKFAFNSLQKRELTRYFRMLLQTAPTWSEKSFINKAIIACGLMLPVVGWLPLLLWDYKSNEKYKAEIRSSAKQAAGLDLKETEDESYTSQASARIKSVFK